MRMDRIVITGGTGYLGRALVKDALDRGVSRIVVFSRSEETQRQMRADVPDERVSFCLGDVRDLRSVLSCFRIYDPDTVIHAAAMKSVPACEEFPLEAVQTNVDGTAHVLDASADQGVPRVVVVSSDKAVNPSGVYGATKALCERMTVASGRMAVRLGNLIGSTGSVLPIWERQAQRGEPITVTDPNMTRFYLSASEAVRFLVRVVYEGQPGVFVPKLKACRLGDLAFAVSANQKQIGPRTGERDHELLLTPDEPVRDLGWAYLVKAGEKPFGRVYRSSLVEQMNPLEVLSAA